LSDSGADGEEQVGEAAALAALHKGLCAIFRGFCFLRVFYRNVIFLFSPGAIFAESPPIVQRLL
jgi:hypothetical protein